MIDSWLAAEAVRRGETRGNEQGWLGRLLVDEDGQDLIEYALLAALVGLATVASMRGLATKISAALTTVGTSLTSNV